MYTHFFKRVIDILLSLIALIVLALPMLIIAIVIKIDSKGPAIFKTHRVGKNCKSFKFYKFRSMRTEAPEDCAPRLLKAEDYVTKVGAFLRKTSLDELPQLFCILKGDMSIVGPRPAGLSEQDLIEAREKHGANKAVPGLTGLAQVCGRDILASHPEEKAKIDGEYVRKITFWGDIKICFRTVGKVFKHDGVVEGEAALEEELPEEAEKELEAAELSEKLEAEATHAEEKLQSADTESEPQAAV